MELSQITFMTLWQHHTIVQYAYKTSKHYRGFQTNQQQSLQDRPASFGSWKLLLNTVLHEPTDSFLFPTRWNFSLLRTLMHTAWIKQTWTILLTHTHNNQGVPSRPPWEQRVFQFSLFCTTSAAAPDHRSTDHQLHHQLLSCLQQKLTSNSKWQGTYNCMVQTGSKDLNSSWTWQQSSDTLNPTLATNYFHSFCKHGFLNFGTSSTEHRSKNEIKFQAEVSTWMFLYNS